VFSHRDHISTIRRTINTIWSRWLPESAHEAADAPDFERYGEEFDPRTGTGGVGLRSGREAQALRVATAFPPPLARRRQNLSGLNPLTSMSGLFP
jgi:GyrI-like small molecule binding domain